jgi:hypothetical protein
MSIKLTSKLTHYDPKEPFSGISMSVTCPSISINFCGTFDHDRIPLRSTLDDIIKKLIDKELFDHTIFEVDRYNECPPYFGLQGNNLIINDSSILLDEIRRDVIKMFVSMYELCPKTELTDYLNEIHDYTLEQLPVIKKLDGSYKLIYDPKHIKGYYDFRGHKYTTQQIKIMCDFLHSDDTDVQLDDRRLQKRTNRFIIDFGFDYDVICPLANISIDKLVEELPKLLIG